MEYFVTVLRKTFIKKRYKIQKNLKPLLEKSFKNTIQIYLIGKNQEYLLISIIYYKEI